MVNITALTAKATTVVYYFVDFQGHVLDLAGSGTAENTPVISYPMNSPATNNQLWTLNGQILENYATSGYLSYPGAPSGPNQYAQATVRASTPANFELIPFANGRINVKEFDTGMYLTAWTAERGSLVTPVTFEAQDGSPEQAWQQVIYTAFET